MSSEKERNYIIGIFGENFEQRNLIGQAFGAPETTSDMQIYDRFDASLGQIFCAITPIDYPNKIKPFLQSLTLTNIHILVVDLEVGLNAVIGEILVGMDLFNQYFNTRALVVIAGINSKTEWKLLETRKKISGILNTTSLNDTEIIELKSKEDYEIIKKKAVALGITPSETESEAEYTKIFIDHVFPVKGIGTVILGLVKQGTVKAGQMLEITGYDGPGKKVIIKSIQKYERNFKTANEGDRVGLALKGNISPDDVSRDNIIVTQGIFKQEREIKAEVHLSQFFKPMSGTIKPGDGTEFYAIVDLKTALLKLVEGDELMPGKTGIVTITLSKPLVHDGTGLKGLIIKLNRFENKLRIV